MTSEELDELLAEAYEHLRQGRYRMALTAAQKVYDEKQYDFNAAICLAWALLENGFPAQALELANLAVQESGDDVNARLYRGFLLMRMSIFEGAISDLNWTISKKPDLLSWAHLNKARALAGLGRYFEGLEEIDKAIEIDKGVNEKLVLIRDWFRKTLGYDEGFLNGIFNKKKSMLTEGEEAFKEKEFWFSLWAARDTLNSPSLLQEHKQAHMLELESLLAMFQIKNAYDKAESVKEEFKDDLEFDNVYQRVLKFYPVENLTDDNEGILFGAPTKTDFEVYENKFFHVYHAKTYDLVENLRAGKRTYLLQFNEDTIRYIGVEIVLDNPFYGNKMMNLDGMAVWYLNNIEVGRHNFNLGIEKDWKVVEFVQSWGTDTPGFWKEGQGRVDIFLDNYLICARWFLVGQSEIVNFEESSIELRATQSLEKPVTDQPDEVKESSLKPQEIKSLEELLTELDSYIGLQGVKESMRDFVNYLSFINERKKLGLKTLENLPVHSVFLGNPGTGKTTIARLLGKIFKAMGLLKNGHVIEVDRSGLVGQYIGETAQKTNKVINEAIGGLLFIDEAYALKKEGNQQDFGQEAIDVLIKRMEDAESEFVVIAAGYPEEMNSFITSNPGLKSRFTHFFNFEDYSPDELIEIFRLTSSKEEYTVNNEALDLLKKQFTALYRKRDKTFGNARLVRNYFNEAKINLSKRYLQMPVDARTKEAMTTISNEDIKALLASNLSKQVQFGIDEEVLSKTLDKLNSLTGLSSVKKEINEIVKLARFYSEQGENLHDKFPEITKEMADAYALDCQKKADKAIKSGKMNDMIIPIEIPLEDGSKVFVYRDQQPRPETTMEALSKLRTPFRENGRVTAGNSAGLNDGAAAVLLISRAKVEELNLEPKMKWVSSGIAAVDPRIMGIAPVPATTKALAKAGLKISDIDIIEINEAFAVQALYCIDQWNLSPKDSRINKWGGSLAYGHPLAASGPRLVAFLAGLFKENPGSRFALTTMCVGRGQGYSIIWENGVRNGFEGHEI